MTEGNEVERPVSEPLPDGRRGLRTKGWVVESCNRPILSSLALQQWEENLRSSHLPEMIFGNSFLSLSHIASGIKIHFNAFDALQGWMQESLPPVEVPAAKKWKIRSKPFQQVTLDYDYTFTTPYCGSEALELRSEAVAGQQSQECHMKWEDCEQQIDLDSPALRGDILFYDEVILYEDELSDNGVSLLTAKVRVMPDCWFLLLRFWLRVDGVLMRLRDTRIYCCFGNGLNDKPTVLREICWREATFKSLSMTGLPLDSAMFMDPNLACKRLPVVNCKMQKLTVGS